MLAFRYNIAMSFFNKKNRQALGTQAEKLAGRYLKQHGLKLLRSNYHCRFGEIDLIMSDGDTIVFVEVRCRQENAWVSAVESINAGKIAKIQKTAQFYLMSFDIMPNCRFDVIAVTHNSSKIGYTIDWIKGAF